MNEEAPKKEVNDVKYVGLIIVGILIVMGAMLSYIFFYEPEVDGSNQIITYNNYQFMNIADTWTFQWQDEGALYTVPLRFSPLDVDWIQIEGQVDSTFNQDEVYITFDPLQNDENLTYVALGAAELSANMMQALRVTPRAACTQNETEACQIREIVTCDDKDKAVIELIDAPGNRVILDGNCIKLQGEGEDLVKSIDRLLYLWYGIIE